MSDVATALLQLIGRTEPAADPALAAVKLARASLDALILRLGQSIDAKVTAQLGPDEIAELFEPMAYQGASQALIDRLIASLNDQ